MLVASIDAGLLDLPTLDLLPAAELFGSSGQPHVLLLYTVDCMSRDGPWTEAGSAVLVRSQAPYHGWSAYPMNSAGDGPFHTLRSDAGWRMETGRVETLPSVAQNDLLETQWYQAHDESGAWFETSRTGDPAVEETYTIRFLRDGHGLSMRFAETTSLAYGFCSIEGAAEESQAFRLPNCAGHTMRAFSFGATEVSLAWAQTI
ncbi:MAG: hypothetical protein ACPHK8_07565 [Thermoplasmatota archaeon]